MFTVVKREYVLSIPTNMYGDVNLVSLKAYNVKDAIMDFQNKYPTLQYDYIVNNIEEYTANEK